MFIVKAMSLSHLYFYLVLVMSLLNSCKAVKKTIATKHISYSSFHNQIQIFDFVNFTIIIMTWPLS